MMWQTQYHKPSPFHQAPGQVNELDHWGASALHHSARQGHEAGGVWEGLEPEKMRIYAIKMMISLDLKRFFPYHL